MAEKETWMILHVDLQCASCYKKIKKILCKFPQIRDQVYDEKKNLVKITVVCCSPEKIRDKLCCKGGKVIKSIEIVVPPKPKEPEKPKPPPEKTADKPKDTPKPKVTIIEPEKPKDAEKAKPPPAKPADKPKDTEKDKPPPAKPADKPKDTPKPAADPPKPPVSVPGLVPVPVPVIPPPQPPVVVAPAQPYPVPVGFCCPQCYEGHGGGPCYFGYGRPVPPPPCYDNYYQGYGYNKGWYVSRCDDYFSEENTSGCRIM